MNEEILFIDTETGGLDPKQHSLLSVGLVVWSPAGIKASQEILLKEKVFRIDHYALKVNKIDLTEHAAKAQTHAEGIRTLQNFVQQNFSGKGIVLAGHNVGFDVGFVKQWFDEERLEFSSLFSHRSIDTHSILSALYLSGLIPEKVTDSNKAFDYFKIEVERRHTALSDALATALLFGKLLDLMRGRG